MSVTDVVTHHRKPSLHKNLFDIDTSDIPQPYSSTFSVNAKKTISHKIPKSYGLQKSSSLPGILKDWLANLTNDKGKDVTSNRNSKVVLVCTLWYFTSSISSNLSKAILKIFPHAVAVTEFQFILVSMLCLSFTILANHLSSHKYKHTKISNYLSSFPEGVLPNYLNGNFQESILNGFLKPERLVLTTTFPMGIFQFIGHYTSHKATSVIPVSLVHSIKALSPIITVAYYRIAHKKSYNPMTYYTLMLLIMGVMTTCWTNNSPNKSGNNNSDLNISSGLLFAFLSMLIFVSQNIFAKGILTIKRAPGMLPSASSTSSVNSISSTEIKRITYSPNQLDKLTILFYCSCIGALLTIPPFVTNEVLKGHSVFRELSSKALVLMLIHCITHFVQALLAFQLIGMLTPVNYSIANIMKRIVIISVALVWEVQLTYRQIFGLALTLAGLYGYHRFGLSKNDSHQQL